MSYVIRTTSVHGASLAEFVDRSAPVLFLPSATGEPPHTEAALALLKRHDIAPLPTQKIHTALGTLFVSLSDEIVDALEQGQNCVRVIIDSRMGDESDAAFMEAANRVLEPLHG